MFRRTLFPQNAPLKLTRTLYDIYALTHSSKEMNFEDFIEVYFLITVEGRRQKKVEQSEDRRADLIFHILQNIGETMVVEGAEKKKKAKKAKRGEEKDELPIENIFTLGVNILQLEQDTIYKLLIQNQLSPDNLISLSKQKTQSILLWPILQISSNLFIICFLENFRQFFKGNLDHPLFSWIQTLACQYKSTLNAQDESEVKLNAAN